MMVILDTDHLSILDQDSIDHFNLGRRLQNLREPNGAVTIVTYEEQMRGWLTYIAKANTQTKQVDAYHKLRIHVEKFRRIPIIDYDVTAAAHFDRFRKLHVRIGTMDLKIASVVVANNAKLLSRNLVDFRKVPGLDVEDRSQ